MAGSSMGWSAPRGSRLKLRAPFGATFYAWSPPEEAQAFMDAANPPPTPEQRTVMLEAMRFARERGYLYSVHVQGYTGEREPAQVFGGPQRELPVTVGTSLEPTRDYMLAGVMAPVFDARGQVALTLSLMGLQGQASGAEVERMGRRVREACDRITSFMGGRKPAPEAAPS